MKKVYDKYQGITFTKSVLESAKKQIDDFDNKRFGRETNVTYKQ